MSVQDLSELKILVTGSLGMLAHDFVPLLEAAGAQFVLTDRYAGKISSGSRLEVFPLDITDLRKVKEVVRDFCPDWVVNLAAFTAVDAAEKERNTAFAVNGEAVGNLAGAQRESGGKLLQISTDYVFGKRFKYGETREPWREDEQPDPCGVYGESKRLGEERALESLADRCLLIRTSWLHGVYGPNFVRTILKLGGERSELKVVNDQIGSPTWTGWLASVMVRLIELDASGVFHASSRGNISWFDFAKGILAERYPAVQILPESSVALGRPAPRPACSTLDVAKLEQFLGEECISWEDGMHRHLAALDS